MSIQVSAHGLSRSGQWAVLQFFSVLNQDFVVSRTCRCAFWLLGRSACISCQNQFCPDHGNNHLIQSPQAPSKNCFHPTRLGGRRVSGQMCEGGPIEELGKEGLKCLVKSNFSTV